MRHLNGKLIASIQLRCYIKPNPKGRNDRNLEKDAKKCYWNGVFIQTETRPYASIEAVLPLTRLEYLCKMFPLKHVKVTSRLFEASCSA